MLFIKKRRAPSRLRRPFYYWPKEGTLNLMRSLGGENRIKVRFCLGNSSPLNTEMHLSAKNTLLSSIEISRIYAAVVCLRCILRPYHASHDFLCHLPSVRKLSGKIHAFGL